MYCRMCGKILDDTDRHCRYCGTATGFQIIPADSRNPIEEEVVFNPPYESDEKQSLFQLNEEEPQEEKTEENLKEFISENEIEQQKKQEDGTSAPSAVKNAEFSWNVHEFPTKKKTEDIEFNWKLEEFGQPEQKVMETAAFEEELFQEIRDEANRIRESNIDRFFTFSKKNEEFQELLDREYEKFNKRPETIAETHTEETHTEEPQTEKIHTEESDNKEIHTVKEERAEEPILEEPILEEPI
ncbi:MAG: zinc ribbon domain-containing protein, partial [Bacillota bacterium]